MAILLGNPCKNCGGTLYREIKHILKGGRIKSYLGACVQCARNKRKAGKQLLEDRQKEEIRFALQEGARNRDERDKPPPKKFSEEEKQKILRLYKEGADINYISRKLGVSKASLRGGISAFTGGEGNLKRKKWGREEEEKLVEMLNQGACSKIIARELGREPAAIDIKISRMYQRGRINMKRNKTWTLQEEGIIKDVLIRLAGALKVRERQLVSKIENMYSRR